ncbi:RlpA-like double-psi beta-barrel-protein domain-containing protein-containing protein [Mycena capillaripes]|nr:RlpA-like double-psi beta-barrel-protein domain-containing protein-containing protein [Mycena capillaripes]
MHFHASSLLAAFFVARVAASPFASEIPDVSTSKIQKRTPGNVFVCEEVNWGGRCSYIQSGLDNCIQLGDDWIWQISSFGPDEGATCFAYDQSDCSDGGSSWTFQSPGDASGGDWADSISSYKCVSNGDGGNGGGGENGGGSGTFTGDATWYTPDGGFGACGNPLQNDDFIVALSEANYDGGSHCGQTIEVQYNGQTIDLNVQDLCPGCGGDGIDIAVGAFASIENTDVGVLSVSWRFV